MPVPRPEHPKPQMRRESWQNLNGRWEFETDMSVSGMDRELWKKENLTGEITVPFCPESVLSGVHFTDFIPAVWYKKKVDIPAEKLNGRVVLHFGAVDYFSRVWVNGVEVGTHKGGYSSFSFDITKAAVAGENAITVYARDDNRAGKQPSGKQSPKYYSHGCSYTRTTGIWQTVWLEFTPESYIKSVKLTPDAAGKKLYVDAVVTGAGAFSAKAFFKGKPAGEARIETMGRNARLAVDLSEIFLWDAGKPNLYDLTLTFGSGDTADVIQSYFGIRYIEWKNHAIYLNGRPLFQRLALDQGFYPDGIYTAPSDGALVKDIELSLELGFNGARLHEKVFEERFLYHADRLGYLVWGEHANWGLDIDKPEGLLHFLPEWTEILERDYNHPSIIGWCPFNESWDRGSFKAGEHGVLYNVYKATKLFDETRPVIDTSGYHHVITDIYDTHDYRQDAAAFAESYKNLQPGEIYEPKPDSQKYGGQPFFVSEYGGMWWKPDGSREGSWGYSMPETEEELCARYESLTGALLSCEAVCAFCYTQLYDTEQECNGLYTYARGRKFSDEIYERVKKANSQKAAIEI